MVAVTVAVVMVVLVGAAALVTDVGAAFAAKAQLQTVADAAALGAANQLPNAASASVAVNDFTAANAPASGASSSAQYGEYLNGVFTATGRQEAARVTVTGGVDTGFAKIFGVNRINMSTTAVAARDVTVDLVIVQDVTGSFEDELPEALAADVELVNALARRDEDEVHMGLVQYWDTAATVRGLDSLANSASSLRSAISGLGIIRGSGTFTAEGIDAAVNLLNSQARGGGVPKYLVLVSDGRPCHIIGPGTADFVTPANEATAAANRAAAAGIDVFTITLDTGDTSNICSQGGNPTFNATLQRGVGFGVTIGSASQFDDELLKIIETFPVKLVE